MALTFVTVLLEIAEAGMNANDMFANWCRCLKWIFLRKREDKGKKDGSLLIGD